MFCFGGYITNLTFQNPKTPTYSTDVLPLPPAVKTVPPSHPPKSNRTIETPFEQIKAYGW